MNLPPPNLEKILLSCAVCSQQRPDKFIKIMRHDVGVIYDLEMGIMILNVKYCDDNQDCKDKAFARGWILKNILKQESR